MKTRLMSLLAVCLIANFLLSSKKCTSPPATHDPTQFPPTPSAPKVPHAVTIKNFLIPSEYQTAFNNMMANCPLFNTSNTTVTTEVIYYDASGNEVVFSTNTVSGSSLSSGPGTGDYQLSENLPYACEYFVRVTVKATVCEECCGETQMANIGLNGDGCFPNSSAVPPIPDAGKPVLIYESDHKMVGPTDLIECNLKEFKCSCDCV